MDKNDASVAPGRRWPNLHSLAIAGGIVLTLVCLAVSHEYHLHRQRQHRPLLHKEALNPPCAHYRELIAQTLSREKPPILSREQLLWIASEVWAAGQGKGVPAKLLVFGLGLDSILWHNVNCHGRTVFLENLKSWMSQVLQREPALEAYLVEYNTTVPAADEFYKRGPWSLPVPATVSGDCWDVILVDAPQGFLDQPGRMQSAQLAMDLARRCVGSGERERVVIFLHDVERPLEQRIAREQILSDAHIYFLGTIEGWGGHLAGYEYSNNIRLRPPEQQPQQAGGGQQQQQSGG